MFLSFFFFFFSQRVCGGTSLRCHVGWSNQGGSSGSGYLDRRGSVSKGRLVPCGFSVVGDWVRNRIVVGLLRH